MKRDVQPEILDQLAQDDPRALRSRRDLRWINSFLGGERWIIRLARQELDSGDCVIELGAGEGTLTRKLLQLGCQVRALDLQPCPDQLVDESGLLWIQGDLLQTLPRAVRDARASGQRITIAANLILHHFSPHLLEQIGDAVSQADALLFAEPHRTEWALICGRMIWPFIGDVTRHDMPVSTRAGFAKGELAGSLDLNEIDWAICERGSYFGGWRFLAKKRAVF